MLTVDILVISERQRAKAAVLLKEMSEYVSSRWTDEPAMRVKTFNVGIPCRIRFEGESAVHNAVEMANALDIRTPKGKNLYRTPFSLAKPDYPKPEQDVWAIVYDQGSYQRDTKAYTSKAPFDTDLTWLLGCGERP